MNQPESTSPVDRPPSPVETPISAELLKILRCPVEGSPLRIASADLIDQINQEVRDGTLRDRLEQRVQQPLEGGLINASETLLYPIRDGIPMLVQEEAIVLGS